MSNPDRSANPPADDDGFTAEEARTELYALLDRDLPFEEIAERALTIGERYLGVENGHVTRIDPESDYWRAIASTDPPDGNFPAGLRIDLGTTYCRRTIRSTTPITLHDAPTQGWNDDPAYEVHGLACYHGTTLHLDGEVYGTVCFVSEGARDPFTELETMFVELLTGLLERALEREHTAARLERFEEFAGVLSHDLRNPLNVAQGRVDLAREARSSDHLAIAARSLDRMEAIIDSVLTVAREGRAVQEMTAVSLADAGADCFDAVSAPDATLTVEGDVRFRADPDRLRRVLENLFRNAVEHGSTSPRSHAREDAVEIRVGPLPDAIGFYVADDGPGIPPAERETIFDAGHTTGRSGVGLGLAIVESIVDAHGWEIEVTESENGGARFEISGIVPVGDDDAESADADRPR